MSKSKNQHVIPYSGKGWAVKRAGADKASKTFYKQKEAIKYAKNKAKKSKSELFIHSRSGKIRERNTYGKDYYPPKG